MSAEVPDEKLEACLRDRSYDSIIQWPNLPKVRESGWISSISARETLKR